ncbi:MAG TPA: hypothetical protein VI541_03540, partial [Actinomycetota bacterium]|nr:hypothetical protein [Actinomycetota bacterium]
WADNDLQVFRGGASGADILDRHDASITFDIGCARWQGTFDVGEMAYITSTDGPIRAIRDYLGTNSGPLTERRHIFYESSEEIRVDLRVHPIPGASEIWNWSTAAVGMRYSTAFGSARVDGQGDAYLGSPAVLPQSWNWETIDRDTPADPSVGGVSIVTYYDSNNPDPVAHSIYRDGGTGGCQNQPYRGAIWNQGPAALVSTDVGTPPYFGTYLYLTRTLHYEAPGTTNGPMRLGQDKTPLVITGSAL